MNMSPSSPQIKRKEPPCSTFIVYGRYTDSLLKELEAIGMSGKIFRRYSKKEVTDRCVVLCSSGWVPPELDEPLIKLQIDLMKNIIERPEVPLEIKTVENSSL